MVLTRRPPRPSCCSCSYSFAPGFSTLVVLATLLFVGKLGSGGIRSHAFQLSPRRGIGGKKAMFTSWLSIRASVPSLTVSSLSSSSIYRSSIHCSRAQNDEHPRIPPMKHDASTSIPAALANHPYYKAYIRYHVNGPLEYFTVAGVTFEGRQRIVKALQPRQIVRLEREPTNPYDPDAIAVRTLNGTQIGYVPRALTSRFRHPIAFGRVESIGKSPSGAWGCKIVTRPDDIPLTLTLPPKGVESSTDIRKMLTKEEWSALCQESFERSKGRCSISGVTGQAIACQPVFVRIPPPPANANKAGSGSRGVYKLWGLMSVSSPLLRAQRLAYDAAKTPTLNGERESDATMASYLFCLINGWSSEETMEYFDAEMERYLSDGAQEWACDLSWLGNNSRVSSDIRSLIVSPTEEDGTNGDLDLDDLPSSSSSSSSSSSLSSTTTTTTTTTTPSASLSSSKTLPEYNFEEMTVKQLQSFLRERGQRVSGTKSELITRCKSLAVATAVSSENTPSPPQPVDKLLRQQDDTPRARKRVLVADQMPEWFIRRLEQDAGEGVGFDVWNLPHLATDELQELACKVDALVVRSTCVPAAVFDDRKAGQSHLSLVIRAGSGTDTIDVSAASDAGVAVKACTGANAMAVAELTFGLMLSVDRGICENDSDFRRKTWGKPRYKAGKGLYGRTLGIIGIGRIGQEVAKRALAFGMHVKAFGRSFKKEEADDIGVERCDTIAEVLRSSDFVSIHLPYSEDTSNIISTPELALMKPEAVIINMARGGVLDESALAAAVAEGRIMGAADVFEDEPTRLGEEIRSPLAELKGFQGTHHIGGSTKQAQDAVGEAVLSILARHFSSPG